MQCKGFSLFPFSSVLEHVSPIKYFITPWFDLHFFILARYLFNFELSTWLLSLIMHFANNFDLKIDKALARVNAAVYSCFLRRIILVFLFFICSIGYLFTILRQIVSFLDAHHCIVTLLSSFTSGLKHAASKRCSRRKKRYSDRNIAFSDYGRALNVSKCFV